MKSFDKSVHVQGKSIVLRAATPDDAWFVFSLRNAAKARFLNPTQGDVETQKAWLAGCHADPMQIYFAICSHAMEPLGLVRIYDLRGDSFCWGSWLIQEGAPPSTAIESALLVYCFALDHGFTRSHFDVRIGNDKVIRFHQGFGAVEVRRDETDVYFEIGREAIEASLHKFRRYLPAGASS